MRALRKKSKVTRFSNACLPRYYYIKTWQSPHGFPHLRGGPWQAHLGAVNTRCVVCREICRKGVMHPSGRSEVADLHRDTQVKQVRQLTRAIRVQQANDHPAVVNIAGDRRRILSNNTQRTMSFPTIFPETFLSNPFLR